MEHDYKDEKLTVYLPVRVDTANAQDTEMKLMDLVDEYEPKTIVIDARDMQYICSAGLRVILNIRKQVPDTSVINTSSVVYEIFKTTGFNIVLNVSKAKGRRGV